MINWKLRFQNKTTLTALVLVVISAVYKILNLIGIVPSIEQQQIIDIATIIIDLLALLGIITDPTTDGLSDSIRAMGYTKPYKSIEENKDE